MKLRYWIKEKLPKSFLPPIRLIFNIYFHIPYWFYYAFLNGKAPAPDRLVYETTFFCNQSCLMCGFAQDLDKKESKVKAKWKEKGELSTNEISRLVDSAKKIGIKNFTISGGEPFVRKDIFEIICLVKRKNFTVTVRSNGTLMDKKKAQKIVEAKPDSIIFSLDGPGKIHNTIRKEKDAFNKLMRGISLINEEKSKADSTVPNLSFNCTISAVNAGYLTEIAEIAGKLKMDVTFTYVGYITNEMLEETEKMFSGGTTEFECLDIPEFLKKVDLDKLKEDVKRVKEKAKKYGIEAKFIPPLKENEIRKYFYSDSFVFANKCLYPWYGLRVNPYGEVNPCSLNLPMGNIREEDLRDIWNNKKYISFRKNLKTHKLFPKCARCCTLNEKLWSFLPSLSSLNKKNEEHFDLIQK